MQRVIITLQLLEFTRVILQQDRKLIRQDLKKKWKIFLNSLSDWCIILSPSCICLWPHGLQHTRLPCPSKSPGVFPSSCSLHWWCHPAISSSDALFFCPSYWVSLVWSPCSPRDFQESSPASQFKGFNSLAFCLLYGRALITICDHWEDRSLAYVDLCQ